MVILIAATSSSAESLLVPGQESNQEFGRRANIYNYITRKFPECRRMQGQNRRFLKSQWQLLIKSAIISSYFKFTNWLVLSGTRLPVDSDIGISGLQRPATTVNQVYRAIRATALNQVYRTVATAFINQVYRGRSDSGKSGLPGP